MKEGSGDLWVPDHLVPSPASPPGRVSTIRAPSHSTCIEPWHLALRVWVNRLQVETRNSKASTLHPYFERKRERERERNPRTLTLNLHRLAGEGHTTRRCRRVTYPESYITKYTAYTKIMDDGSETLNQKFQSINPTP